MEEQEMALNVGFCGFLSHHQSHRLFAGCHPLQTSTPRKHMRDFVGGKPTYSGTCSLPIPLKRTPCRPGHPDPYLTYAGAWAFDPISESLAQKYLNTGRGTHCSGFWPLWSPVWESNPASPS